MSVNVSLHNQSILQRENIAQFIRRSKNLKNTIQAVRYGLNTVFYFQSKLDSNELCYMHKFINSILSNNSTVVKLVPLKAEVIDYTKGLVNHIDIKLNNSLYSVNTEELHLLQKARRVTLGLMDKANMEAIRTGSTVVSCLEILSNELKFSLVSAFVDFDYFIYSEKPILPLDSTHVLELATELAGITTIDINSVDENVFIASRIFK